MFDSLLSFLIRSSALLVLGGWVLSSISELGFRGYAVLGLIILGVAVFEIRRCNKGLLRVCLHRRLLIYFQRRRLLPLIYIFVAVSVFAGALLYEPNNFDGLSYRVPKILFWLHNRGWYWIDSPYLAVNCSLPNYEWLTIPLFFVSGGIHLQVLINLVCFLLVPPLFFSLLLYFGVARRVAYDWMWIFPCGYGVALQAGGIGNDLLGLVAILAALHCARRFVTLGEPGFLIDALLAAAFLTGIKLSNPPLVGLVAIILLGNVKLLSANRRALFWGLTGGLAISAATPLALNLRQTGTILGAPPNYAQVTNPLAGLVGNALTLASSAAEPPIFPGAHQVSAAIEDGLGSGTVAWLTKHYEKFSLKHNELPQEESSCLGIGITLALLWCTFLWMNKRDRSRPSLRHAPLRGWQKWSWCVWLIASLAALLMKLGTGVALPRNLLPWSPVAVAPLIAIVGREAVIRSRAWRFVAVGACLSVLPALFLSPSRPLIPPSWALSLAERLNLKPAAIERMRVTYAVYAKRADPFVDLRERLPGSVRELALVSNGEEPTASFFKPYGKRTCRYLRNANEVEAARKAGVEYAILNDSACATYFRMDLDQWCSNFHAEPLYSERIQVVARLPADRYTLVKLRKMRDAKVNPGIPGDP